MNAILLIGFVIAFAAGAVYGIATYARDMRDRKDVVVSKRRYVFMEDAANEYNRIEQYFLDNRGSLELLSLKYGKKEPFSYEIVAKYRRLDPDFNEKF